MTLHRIRPSDNPSAWDITTATQPKTIKLQQQHMKSAATPSQDFRFDEILTGSENKPVYNAVARSHVCAAMDGYNSVIFAYGQTASGKTFTLVRLVSCSKCAAVDHICSLATKTNPVSSLVQ